MADSVESLGEIIKDYAKKYQALHKHIFGQGSGTPIKKSRTVKIEEPKKAMIMQEKT